jgi:tetratricopeptide (TPR) repeat protein
VYPQIAQITPISDELFRKQICVICEICGCPIGLPNRTGDDLMRIAVMKKLVLIALFVVTFAGSSLATQKYSPEMMRKREEAERLITKSKEKLQKNPDDIQAHKAIGNSYLFLEEYEAAYNSFKEVLRVAPNDAEAYWGMGQAYTQPGDDTKALDFYKNAVRLDPRLAKAQADLGKTLVRLFQYNDAIGPLKEGIRLKAKGEVEHADYYSLGEAYLRTGKYQEAIGAYSKALEVLQGHVWTHAGIAEAYNGTKQYENAVANAKRALELMPYDYRSNRALGDAYAGMRQYEKAVEYYNESIRVSSHRSQIDALLALGLTYNRMGKHQEAIGVFEKGIQYATTPKQFQTEPGTDPALLSGLYFSTAEANLNLDRGEAAAQAAQKYIELQTWSDANAPYAALMSYFGNRKAGRDEEAQKVLAEAFTRTDTKSWVASIIKYLRGDLKEKDLLALATDNDKMTEARAYVGMNLVLERRLDAARPHLEWVVKNGNRDFIEYTLAQAELRRITSR